MLSASWLSRALGRWNVVPAAALLLSWLGAVGPYWCFAAQLAVCVIIGRPQPSARLRLRWTLLFYLGKSGLRPVAWRGCKKLGLNPAGQLLASAGTRLWPDAGVSLCVSIILRKPVHGALLTFALAAMDPCHAVSLSQNDPDPSPYFWGLDWGFHPVWLLFAFGAALIQSLSVVAWPCAPTRVNEGVGCAGPG